MYRASSNNNIVALRCRGKNSINLKKTHNETKKLQIKPHAIDCYRGGYRGAKRWRGEFEKGGPNGGGGSTECARLRFFEK